MFLPRENTRGAQIWEFIETRMKFKMRPNAAETPQVGVHVGCKIRGVVALVECNGLCGRAGK